MAARLWQIDLTRFFNDQADLLQSAASFLQRGGIPLSSGLTFAVGTTGGPIRHPPLITVLVAMPMLVSQSPVWVSAWSAMLDALAAPLICWIVSQLTWRRSVAIAAGVLYALNPTAILFGRMIWNPDFVGLFATVGLLGLVDFVLHGRSGSLAISLFAIGCAAELHVVNGILIPIWLVVAILGRQKLQYRPLSIACLLLLATIAPYLYLQTQSDWADARNLVGYLLQPKRMDLDVLDTASAITGPTMFGWYLPAPGTLPVPFHYDGFSWALIGLTWVGVAATWRKPRAARWVVLAWLAVPILSMVRRTGSAAPHYLLAVVPAVAVLQALGLEECWAGVSALASRASVQVRKATVAFGVGTSAAAIAGGLAVNYLWFQSAVSRDTRQLEYGMPLRYSMVAGEAVRSKVGNEPFVLGVPFLYNRTVPYLAGRGAPYQWYWDRSAFIFPATSAWYLVQNDSFGQQLLTERFGQPMATVPNDMGQPEFALYQLPEKAWQQLFKGPGFRPLGDQQGPIQMEGLLDVGLSAGQRSEVLFLWQTGDPSQMPGHLSQFAHVVDRTGETVSTDADLWDIREPWRSGDQVATGFDLNVEPDVPTGGYWLETGFYETFSQAPLGKTVRIGPIRIAGRQPANLPDNRLAIFGDAELDLVQADWQGQDVVLQWRADRKPKADYTVFVHAVDDSGRLVAQHDGLPQDGAFPTTLWEAGDVVRDHHHLGLAQSQSVRLEIGLYTRPDLTRLSVRRPGFAEPADQLTIKPPIS